MKMVITVPDLPNKEGDANLMVQDLYASEARDGLVNRYLEKSIEAYRFPITEERREAVLASYEALRSVFENMTITFEDE